jgi:hypothetical protein
MMRSILVSTNSLLEVGFFTHIDPSACQTHHDLISGSMRFPISEAKVDSAFYYRNYSRVDWL